MYHSDESHGWCRLALEIYPILISADALVNLTGNPVIFLRLSKKIPFKNTLKTPLVFVPKLCQFFIHH
jgi:hypothetical protein